METREGIRDGSVAVFHVDDDEVVAGEAGDFGESWGEGEEEDAVESFAGAETGFEVAVGRGGCCGGDGVVREGFESGWGVWSVGMGYGEREWTGFGFEIGFCGERREGCSFWFWWCESEGDGGSVCHCCCSVFFCAKKCSV